MVLDGSSGRLRLWLERGASGFHLRDAETNERADWDDPRFRVISVAGTSYRLDVLQDAAFAPGSALTLVRERANPHDPNAIAIWDAELRNQAGYVPAELAAEIDADSLAVSLWEFRGDDGRRVGLRVLIAPPGAWVGKPRP